MLEGDEYSAEKLSSKMVLGVLELGGGRNYDLLGWSGKVLARR